nr:hypothetical protein [Vibrio casei]
MARVTDSMDALLALGDLFITLDTVAIETLASFATSLIVAMLTFAY